MYDLVWFRIINHNHCYTVCPKFSDILIFVNCVSANSAVPDLFRICTVDHLGDELISVIINSVKSEIGSGNLCGRGYVKDVDSV